MNDEQYLQLHSILSEVSKYPHVHQFLDDDFIWRQCESGLKCFMLKRLPLDPVWEERLAALSTVDGYDRLGPLLRDAVDWDGYKEAEAQVDVGLWFHGRSILSKLSPALPGSEQNSADLLLRLSAQDIYCEVTTFQSLAKALDSRPKSEENRIQERLLELRKGQPWMTKQYVKNEFEVKRAVRTLLKKTNRQLPQDYPDILVLHTAKSMVFGDKVREIASRLFPQRQQVALIMLWSLEGYVGRDKTNPSLCLVNSNSIFRKVGEALLEHLGFNGQAV